MADAETKEEFLARYPRPGSGPSYDRVLVKCECEDEICTGWAWGFLTKDTEDRKSKEPFANGLSPWETLAENISDLE